MPPVRHPLLMEKTKPQLEEFDTLEAWVEALLDWKLDQAWLRRLGVTSE
jgi:hypothetical protein